MEKDKIFTSEEANKTAIPIWSSCNYGMEIQSNKLNSGSEQIPNCFFNPNWDNSMDQSDFFEAALSSIVSSPTSGGDGDQVMIRELIGKLGSICNSGEISPPPQSYIYNNNHSTNTSCYSTPLNSPPKLNVSSIIDSKISGNFSILGNHPSLAPFPTDPGFAERAARFSCFGISLNEQLIQQPRCKVSLKPVRAQVNVNEDGNSNSDKKFSSLSISLTPENAEFRDSREESSLSEQIPGGELNMKAQNNSNDSSSRKRKAIPKGKAKGTLSSSPSEAKVIAEKDESNAKRSKSEETNENEKAKDDNNKDDSKPPEPAKDYIHVRARRGQATDSHSLAERVRREKISERMKFLQDLVPGCNKVNGKAVMLDEIINYVQSLQRQVEFLSMKLAAVNPRMDFNMEAILSKDIFQSRGSINGVYPFDSPSPSLSFPYGYQSQSSLSNANAISSNAHHYFSMNPSNDILQRDQSMQLPPLDGFGDAARQVSCFWEDDLQSFVQMGFGQNQQQTFPGAKMKVEI